MDSSKREQLRDATFQQSKALGQKQRHGLFSAQVSNALGETNSHGVPKVARRDEDGKVVTEPRNFYTTSVKKGHSDKVLFSKPSYVSVENPYSEPVEKVLRSADPKGHSKAGHDAIFKPAKNVRDKSDYKSAYVHMVDRVDVKKNFRDADGAVIKGPTNFYTTPAKQGRVGRGTSFTPQPKHMPDQFDYGKVIARKEMEEGKKLEQDKPFSQVAKLQHVFTKDKEIYDVSLDIKARPPRKESAPPMEQEVAWKPSKPSRQGHSCTIGKYPEYKENPLKFVERRRPVDGEESPPAFKRAKPFQSRPSPSVMTNMKNIKSSFPSIFRK